MYVNGVLLGILGTLSAELAAVVLAAIICGIKAGGSNRRRNP